MCADFVEGFRKLVAADRGLEAPTDLPESTDYSFSDWGIDQSDYLRMSELRLDMYSTLDPIAGAAQSIDDLASAGWRIRIITQRAHAEPGIPNGDICMATIKWLDDNGFVYHDLCFVGDKRDVAASLYIDDSPAVVEGLRDMSRVVVVYDRPYNRHLPGWRIRGWGKGATGRLGGFLKAVATGSFRVT